MKKLICFLLAFLLIVVIFLTFRKNDEEVITLLNQETLTEGNLVIENDITILSTTFATPNFSQILANDEAIDSVNLYFNTRKELLELEWDDLKVLASSEAANANFIAYEYSEYLNITYQNSILFSSEIITNKYTGGSTTYTSKDSQTFLKEDGSLLLLSDLFIIDDWFDTIFTQIEAAINADPLKYYANAIELARSAFNGENYYISYGKLVFFYEPYEIAAYSEGVCEFEVKIEDILNIINKEMVGY